MQAWLDVYAPLDNHKNIPVRAIICIISRAPRIVGALAGQIKQCMAAPRIMYAMHRHVRPDPLKCS